MLPSVMMYTFVSDAVYQYYNDVWLQSNNTAVCPINITACVTIDDSIA
jgi:hypothetical protein